MKFVQKTIDEATPDELRAFASTFLGIPVEGSGDAEVLAKVKAANEGSIIYVAQAEEATDQTGAPPVAVEAPAPLVGGLGRNDPKVRITLHAEERDGVVVSRHKEVGVNGVVWLLARGQSIEIPYRVFHALEIAERDNITHTQDGEVVHSKVKNTPYNVEMMPPAEEIAAWRARTDSQFVPA